MEKRISLCPGGEKQFLQLLDDFFGFEADGSPKPPVVQAVVNAVKGGKWGGDSYSAGEALHTFEGLCNEPDMEAPMTYAYGGRLDRLADVITAVSFEQCDVPLVIVAFYQLLICSEILTRNTVFTAHLSAVQNVQLLARSWRCLRQP